MSDSSKQLEQLCESAIELPADAREPYLRDRCGPNLELYRAALSFLWSPKNGSCGEQY